MDKTLKFLPKLFVDKMIKECMFENVKVVAQLSGVAKCKNRLMKWNKYLLQGKKGKIL